MPANDDIRDELIDLFTEEATDSFDVYRDQNQTAADSYGKRVPNPVKVNSNSVPCFYQEMKGAERAEALQISASHAYTIFVPAYWAGAVVDVTEGDQLRVLARGDEPARTFEVASIGRNQGITLMIIASLEGS
jgi:hypothetical protein